MDTGRGVRDEMIETFVAMSGSLAPLLPESEAARALSRLPLEGVATGLIREKVCLLVLDRLSQYAPAAVANLQSHEDLQRRLAKISTAAAAREELLCRLDAVARDLGIRVWAIKGVCAREWYSVPKLRDMGDVDIMVETLDDVYALTELLLQEGYDYEARELPWIKKRLDTQGIRGIYGQVNLRFSNPALAPNIDIHFGGYSVRHCGLLPLSTTSGEPGLAYFSAQENLPLIVANAAGDHRITTKDLNDLYLCLVSSQVDWESASRQLDAVALRGFFNHMLARTLRIFRLDAHTAQLVRQLLSDGGYEMPRPNAHRSPERRLIVTVLHSYKLSARQSRRQALRQAISAFRYYRRPLRLRLRRFAIDRRPSLPSLNPWTCIRLVPAALARQLLPDGSRPEKVSMGHEVEAMTFGARLRVIRTPSGDLVRSSRTDFIPTVYYDLNPRLISLARQESSSKPSRKEMPGCTQQ